MYKVTHVETLGTEYTVSDLNGVILKTIQIIPQEDILDAALGEYNEEQHGTYTQYLEKSIQMLTGFETVNPNKILWFATEDEEVGLSDLIEYAYVSGYDKIILEHLEELDQ